MASSHADTVGQQTDSSGKMRIAFLMNTELKQQELRRGTEVDSDMIGTDPPPHSQVTSTLSEHDLHPEDQCSRVGRWVASQSLTPPSDYDLGHLADGDEGMPCGLGQWPTAQSNRPVDTADPPKAIACVEQQNVGSEVISAADTRLLRPWDFGPPTRRSRSPRLVYTREEKLFIMHARVLEKASWTDISRIFEIVFGSRNTHDTIAGLRSIYYRTRREWGMDYVTRSGSAEVERDEWIVKAKLREHAETMTSGRARRRMPRLDLALEKLGTTLRSKTT